METRPRNVMRASVKLVWTRALIIVVRPVIVVIGQLIAGVLSARSGCTHALGRRHGGGYGG